MNCLTDPERATEISQTREDLANVQHTPGRGFIERLSNLAVMLAHKGIDAAPVEDAMREIMGLNDRVAETQMLAFKWMDAHDKLQAGRPYKFPSPADLPECVAELLEALRRIRDLPPGKHAKTQVELIAAAAIAKVTGGEA